MYMRALKSVATLMVVFWDRWGWWSRLRCVLIALFEIYWQIIEFTMNWNLLMIAQNLAVSQAGPHWRDRSQTSHPAHHSGNWPFLVSDIFTLPIEFTFCWLATSKSIPGSSCSGAWPKMIISFSQLSEMFPQFHFFAKMNFGATQPDQHMRYSYSKIDNLIIKKQSSSTMVRVKMKTFTWHTNLVKYIWTDFVEFVHPNSDTEGEASCLFPKHSDLLSCGFIVVKNSFKPD